MNQAWHHDAPNSESRAWYHKWAVNSSMMKQQHIIETLSSTAFRGIITLQICQLYTHLNRHLLPSLQLIESPIPLSIQQFSVLETVSPLFFIQFPSFHLTER